MAHTPESRLFDMEFLKKMIPLDMSGLIETQRKNIETLTQTQQLMMERMSAIGKHQAEMISRLVEDQATLAQQLMTEGTPEEKVARQTDLLCKTVEHSIEGMTELADLISESGKDASSLIGKRVTASLSELKSAVEKKKEAA